MPQTDIYAKLNGIFEEVFDQHAIALTPDMTPADVEGWDSVAQIRLIVAIEEAFGFQFAADQISPDLTIGDLVNIISEKRQ